MSFEAEIIENNEVASEHYEMWLKGPEGMDHVLPGQFFNLLCSQTGSHDPLLRRPFSLYRKSETAGIFSVLYRVVGRGTAALARMQPGSGVGVLGPLGKSFPLDRVTGRSVLVGGGVGVPPVYALAAAVRDKGVHPATLLGFSTKKFVVAVDHLERLGGVVHVSTDDGSAGAHGLVTERLLAEIETRDIDTIFACGPLRMLEAVCSIATAHTLPVFVSMEGWMGCGVGTCLSCVHPIQGADGRYTYQRICREGPVFDGRKVGFHVDI